MYTKYIPHPPLSAIIGKDDYENNLGVAFRDLREEKEFFVVTLACEDEQVEAHKVILSSCSPFFQNRTRFYTNKSFNEIYGKISN